MASVSLFGSAMASAQQVASTALPVVNGKHINYALIGKDWLNYNYTIVLSHFKGHPMAGFGGALKNMGIGLQSREGKASRDATHVLDYAEQLGMGTQKYVLITIE